MPEPFDIVIIGGGINGAGIARDASLRGLRVCLLETDDWGSGTSSKSSMLAHGGLRYLEHLEFGLVHEALQGRELMMQQAPHLVRPLQFLYPILPDVASRRTVRVGLMLYDLLSHGKSTPNRGYLNPAEALEHAPGLDEDGLVGAATYWDGQFQSVERFVWELVQDARTHGADCRNHTPVARVWAEGGVARGVELVDGSRVAGRLVINAAGPWVDDLVDAPTSLVRGTKGVHLAVPGFLPNAMIVRAQDERTFFFLPWNQWTLIGTTDTDFEGDPRECTATNEDVAYLLAAAKRYFPAHEFDVQWTYAGVRPLVAESGLTPSSVSRKHKLHDHAKDGIDGLWSLQGGKLTTYRHFAEQVVNRACKRLGRGTKLRPTRKGTLPGGPLVPWTDFRDRAVAAAMADYHLAKRMAQHVVDTYGAQWQSVLDGRDCARIDKKHPHLWAEIEHAVLAEDAIAVADVMLRRTNLGLAPEGNVRLAARVARRMQDFLGWDDARFELEMDAYRKEAARFAVPQPET